MKKLYVVAQIDLRNDEVSEPFVSFCPTLEDAILIAQEALADDKEDNMSDYYYRIYGCELLEFDDEGSVYNVACMPQQLEKSIYPNTIV